jgi:hypothetical protein
MLASTLEEIDHAPSTLAPGAIVRESDFSAQSGAYARSNDALQIFFSIRASSAKWDSALVTILKRVYHVPLAANFRSYTETFLRKV